MGEDNQPMISVIIPVHNKSRYLGDCMNSLLAQSIDSDKCEVVFIDDGSADDSLILCKGFESKYDNVRVFHQENQGVSAARNAGIDRAVGKYILFLDADDKLSDNAIADIVEAFEAFGDDTDAVAYRIVYYNPKTQKHTYHKREQWLNSRGVFSLEDNPFIAQSTMNVCVRNRYRENVYFNSAMKMGEDQLYITQNLLRTGTIGYCPTAEYIYVRDGANSSSWGNLPYYSFNDMMTLYSSLIEYAEHMPNLSSYMYQLVLYNLDWRMRSTKLFPSSIGYSGSDDQEAQLISLMKRIPAREYCFSPYINEYHKGYLLARIGVFDETTLILHTQNVTGMVVDGDCLWLTLPAKVIFSRLQIWDGVMQASGRLACPTFIGEDKPSLEVTLDGVTNIVDLTASSYDYLCSKVRSAKCWDFSFNLDCSYKTPTVVGLKIKTDGKPLAGFQVDISPKTHNACLIDRKLYFSDVKAEVQGTGILVSPISKKDRKLLRDKSLHNKRMLIHRVAIMAYKKRMRGHRTWMYVDNPKASTEGNALFQFLADIGRKDGIRRYYVSNYMSNLISKYPQLRGRVVPCGSRKHAYLSILSEVVLASYLEEFSYLPMKRATYNMVGDFSAVRLRVYLQHGVLHAHMPWYFSFDRLMFDKEVISTSFERENLTTNYGFPDSALIDSGAPSLDMLKPLSAHGKRILYAPSWRKYLVTGNEKQRFGNEDLFKESSLYQGMRSLIDKIAESGILEREDATFEIKLHPNFECYKHLFNTDNPRVSLVPDAVDVNDYGLMITDFSSYVYDFVYSGAAIVYFIPDSFEFEIGLNHYWELDLKYEDGFGPYCTDADQAAMEIEKFLTDTRDVEKEHARKDKINAFFLHDDGRNSERLYRNICDALTSVDS